MKIGLLTFQEITISDFVLCLGCIFVFKKLRKSHKKGLSVWIYRQGYFCPIMERKHHCTWVFLATFREAGNFAVFLTKLKCLNFIRSSGMSDECFSQTDIEVEFIDSFHKPVWRRRLPFPSVKPVRELPPCRILPEPSGSLRVRSPGVTCQPTLIINIFNSCGCFSMSYPSRHV